MDYNDYELIYMVRENDEEAFNLILKKYEPLIKKLCFFYAQKYKIFNIDIEDLKQECRITLFNTLCKFDQNKDILFYSFVIVCIKRGISSYIRRIAGPTRYCESVSIDDDDNYMQFEDNYFYAPPYLIDENYVSNLIIKFKNELNFDDACVFELRYNSFSYKDISILLDIPFKTVDNKLLKIRNKLKKYLFQFE